MASTTPSQQISVTTIALASAGVIATGALAYAFYFDYRRRTDATFREQLKKQHKKVSKASEQEAKASERSQKEKIKRVVDEANEEGFPRDPEETEGYFMQEVARGEGLCTDGSDPVDAALCFYKALKVYPQPRELISIYDKTVPKVSGVQREVRLRACADTFLAHSGHSGRDDRCGPKHIRFWLELGCWSRDSGVRGFIEGNSNLSLIQHTCTQPNGGRQVVRAWLHLWLWDTHARRRWVFACCWDFSSHGLYCRKCTLKFCDRPIVPSRENELEGLALYPYGQRTQGGQRSFGPVSAAFHTMI